MLTFMNYFRFFYVYIRIWDLCSPWWQVFSCWSLCITLRWEASRRTTSSWIASRSSWSESWCSASKPGSGASRWVSWSRWWITTWWRWRSRWWITSSRSFVFQLNYWKVFRKKMYFDCTNLQGLGQVFQIQFLLDLWKKKMSLFWI